MNNSKEFLGTEPIGKLLFKLAEKNCEYAAEYEIVNGGEEQRPDLT